jgi:hypothetical protein
MRTTANRLGVKWRDVSYAFVVVGENDYYPVVAPIMEVAIADAAGPLLHSRLDLSRIPPLELGDVCSMVERAVRGRVVVTHGPNDGWRLLMGTCSRLAPMAMLDSLGLARALVPSGPCGLTELSERFSVRPPPGDRAEQAVVRDACLLGRMFEQLVDRTVPWATVGHLVYVGSRSAGAPPPELGLENG